MNMLLLATAAFLLVHMGLASTPLRPALVGSIGEGPYRGLFSLLSLAALVWMAIAFAGAPRETLWATGPALQAVPLVAMPFALLGIVLGNSTPNPTSAGQSVREEGEAAQGVLRITRHPSNMGIALWAAAHIAATGDTASLIFFGGLFVLATAGSALIDRRRRTQGAAWERYEAVTSIMPFAAILAGRNRFVPGEIGWKRVAVTLVIYAALIWAHPWLFGVVPY